MNSKREDLNDIDRAMALRKLKESLGISWEKLAFKLVLSKRRLLYLVSLLKLPKSIKKDIKY